MWISTFLTDIRMFFFNFAVKINENAAHVLVMFACKRLMKCLKFVELPNNVIYQVNQYDNEIVLDYENIHFYFIKTLEHYFIQI